MMNAVSTPAFILLANGSVGAAFLERVLKAGAGPVLVVRNADGRQRDGARLLAMAEAHGTPVIDWSPASRLRILRRLAERDAPWLLSVYFGHVVDAELLSAAGGRAVNLHPSLLPWNRGVHTNVWPIIERTPAGVSLHVMSRVVDSGAILAQTEVSVEPDDTAATLYARLESAALELLSSAWPAEVLAKWPGAEQTVIGTTHRLRDFAALETYDLDHHPGSRRFYDLLRARSFPPHAGLRVIVDGRLVEATISLRDIGPAVSDEAATGEVTDA